MTTPVYFPVGEMLEMIAEPSKAGCLSLYLANRQLFMSAPGSSHNHQNWGGGYFDHIRECLNLAIIQYRLLDSIRSLPFSLSDALLILFIHDIEKPWKYEASINFRMENEFRKKEYRKEFRLKKLEEYHIILTPEQLNALKYVEGEGDDYTNEKRVMNELAAFCHIIDVLSARLWHDYPKSLGEDTWAGAQRIQ